MFLAEDADVGKTLLEPALVEVEQAVPNRKPSLAQQRDRGQVDHRLVQLEVRVPKSGIVACAGRLAEALEHESQAVERVRGRSRARGRVTRRKAFEQRTQFRERAEFGVVHAGNLCEIEHWTMCLRAISSVRGMDD